MNSAFYTLLNIFIFIFWFRIWVSDSRETFFNRYLLPLARISDRMIDFLRPAFLGAPDRVIAAVVFAALIILRGMAVPNDSDWTILMGFERSVDFTSLPSCIIFSALSFAAFLFTIYSLALIYLHTSRTHGTHPAGALFNASLPFTSIKPEIKPLALLIFGMTIAGLADYYGTASGSAELIGYGVECAIDWSSDPAVLNLTKILLVTLAAWVQVVALLAQIIMLLIIASWISMFTSLHQLRTLSREWIGFLLGPLSSRPIILGNFDLTPILFYFGVNFISGILMRVLINSLGKL